MKHIILSTCMLSLIACSSSDDSNDDSGDLSDAYRYQVSVTNLTNNQPFSPIASFLQSTEYQAWEVGSVASVEIEKLAESGNASPLVDGQSDHPTNTTSGVLLPGSSVDFEISSNDIASTFLTVATMLVNTNDAFTGVTGISLSALESGDKEVFLTNVYDSGSEFNDELSSTVPGPAAGGEGFNAERNDVTSVVTMHSGVVSQQDGYGDSSLTESHRFDNAVMRVVVSRL